MSLRNRLRTTAASAVRQVSPKIAENTHERRTAPESLRDHRNRIHQLEEQLSQSQAQIDALRDQLGQLQERTERLDRDLDESRRLNLRAGELLDIVQTEIVAGGNQA